MDTNTGLTRLWCDTQKENELAECGDADRLASAVIQLYGDISVLKEERNEAIRTNAETISKFLEGVRVNESLYADLKNSEQEAQDFLDERDKSELSRTELIKQNAALAAENERLEAVIKAAQEQSPVAYVEKTLDEVANAADYHDLVNNGYIDPSCYSPLFANPVPAQSPDAAAFKNLHRLLCERFNYGHDEIDWRRDQASLIEHIAAAIKPAVAVPDGWKLVPFNPTQEMQQEGDNAVQNNAWSETIWHTMLAAAPDPAPSHDRCPSHEPLHPVLQACGVQDSGWLQDEARKCADSCKDWPDWRKRAVTAEQDSGVVDHE